MTQLSAGEKKLLGLGRYRFRERLSTSFFGPRLRVTYDAQALESERPPQPDRQPEPQSSSRPRPDIPLAMRVAQVETPSAIERLARAVQSVRDLEHRAIVRPMQLVRSSTRLGVVTPNLDGVTLSQLLEDASMQHASIPPDIALRITLDVLEGLEALRVHISASRHQDALYGGLTPDSVLVSIDGQARILDPGLASAAARQSTWAHEAAVLAYTAPELTGPDAAFTCHTDIFALGVMLWEMLTGRPLFGAITAAQTLENLHRALIPRVQRHQFVRGEPIAAALADTVSQALRRIATQRFDSYDAFATALTQAAAPASPSSVADLVKQTLTHESIEELRERMARAKADATPAGALPSNLLSLSLPPRRAAFLPPQALTGSVALPERATAVAAGPRHVSHATQNSAPGVVPERRATVHSLRPTRFERFASHLPPALSQKLSTFPIGDLLRTPQLKTGSKWQIAVAACALLGLGAWALRAAQAGRGRGEEVQSSVAAVTSPPAPLTPTSAAQPLAGEPDAAPPAVIETPQPSAAATTAQELPLRAPTENKSARGSAQRRSKTGTKHATEGSTRTNLQHAAPAAVAPNNPAQFIPDDI
ncbi:MAG: hypothetical protein RL701_1786 [Pseudomonadota bacterium]